MLNSHVHEIFFGHKYCWLFKIYYQEQKILSTDMSMKIASFGSILIFIYAPAVIFLPAHPASFIHSFSLGCKVFI